MTLNGWYALYCSEGASFWAHHKNLHEDRPILSAAMTLLSGDIRFIRIFAEVPWGAGVKRQWGCRQRQFTAFLFAISSETLEMRPLRRWPALLFSDMQSVVNFLVTPKYMTLNDLEWLFCVKFGFRAGLAGWLRPWTLWKRIKIDTKTYCQQRESSAGTLVSDNIRFLQICALGSLERRR